MGIENGAINNNTIIAAVIPKLIFIGKAICNPLIGLAVISDVSKNGATDNASNPTVKPVKIAPITFNVTRKATNLSVCNVSSTIPIPKYCKE